MSDFTDRMYKTFLPSAEAYIKSIQAQHRDPMKQIALINKEIATLTNPQNLKRASKSSDANTKQYMAQLFKAQDNAKKSAGKAQEQLQKNLDTYQENYRALAGSFQSGDSQDKLASAIRDLTEGTGPSLLEQNVAEIVKESGGGKEQTRKQLFVLAAIDSELGKTEIDETTGKPIIKDYSIQRKAVQKLFLEKLLVPTINQDQIDAAAIQKRIAALDKNPTNINALLNELVPRLDGSAEQYLMNPELIPKTARGKIFNKVRLSESDKDLALIRSEIKRTRDLMAGRNRAVSLPSATSSFQEKKAYVEQLVPRGLTLDEQTDRIIVDPNVEEYQQKLALDFISKNVGRSSKYSDFIQTEPVLQQASGITSGEAATKRMLDRAAELEERKEGLIQLAVLNRDITPAEQAVLRNPVFTRPSMRRTAPFRLMKRARGLDDRLAALNEELSQFDQPQEAPVQSEADAVPVTRGETTGVPVIPATVKIFQDAVTRYDVSGDIGSLTAARDAFFAMPVAVRDNFPKIFSEQLANLSNDKFPLVDPSDPRKIILLDETTSKGGFDRKARLDALMASLDQTELTTETVSDFVALLAEDDSPDNVNRTKSMVNFMSVFMTPNAPANALGKGADSTVDPMGSLGLALANAETPEEIAAVKERAAQFAQSGVGYDPNVYGTYAGIESVDPDEVAPEEPPVEQPVEQPEAPPPPPSRPSRMDRRIARRAKQIEADRRAKELAATEQQQQELASRNFARQVERDDEEDAVAEQEFIDEMVDIPTLKEGTLETDPDRFADQQKMIRDVEVKLEQFKFKKMMEEIAELQERQKEEIDQAAADAALAAIQDPGTMDVGPVRSISDQLRDENRRRRRSRQQTPPETPRDPFDMGLPVPPPKSKEESERDSTNDLLIASTRTSPPKSTKPTRGQGSDSGLLVGEMPQDPTDRMTLEEFDLTGRTTAADLDSQTNALFKQISLAVEGGAMTLPEANEALTDYARRGPYDQQKIGAFQGQLNEQFGSKGDAFDELDREAQRLEKEGLIGETTTETKNPDGTVSGRVVKTPKPQLMGP